jgi:ubiquinone/menaquinone biosynthesis C-methylase UbiE
VACLNHIPYREDVLREARRVLAPGGHVVVTMIGSWIGTIGHALWWYSEDKRRDVDEHELMGMSPDLVMRLLRDAGFRDPVHTRFLYRLDHLFVARR